MEEHSISELQQKMDAGELSAQALTQYYLDQITKEDQQLNAVLEKNPDALAIAEALDRERSVKGKRSLLHGIPLLVKDNIDIAGNMTTTAGSLALEGAIAQKSAYIVQRLRAAGAVILGKTNLSEWANFRSSRSSSGWSSRGGQTRNPYVLNRSPGGSSSGSGVAVAVNFCAAAIGTETDGSIIGPSAMNSIVGIKPTVGLIGRTGIIPISHSQDTAGPMARTVTDAAIVLGILVGIDPDDPVTQESRGKAYKDYTRFLDRRGLRGARLGIARDCWSYDHRIERILEHSIAIMREQGAQIIDPVVLPSESKLREPEITVMMFEFKAGINRYLAGLGNNAPVRNLQDVIAFNMIHRDRVMPYFQQELLLAASVKGSLDDEAYRKALAACRRISREQGIDAVINRHRLDAIIAPTTSTPWLIDLINGDNRSGSCARSPAIAGYPHITVPAGYDFGLPVGISFISSAYREPNLLKVAYSFEQASKVRKPPKHLPSVELAA